MKLTEQEENLKPEELFLKWLIEEKVDFISLSESYTKYLENEKHRQKIKNARYSNLLAQYLQYGKLGKSGAWVKDKTIGTLVAYEEFKTAPIFSKWEERIDKYNINTDLNTLDYEVYTKEGLDE